MVKKTYILLTNNKRGWNDINHFCGDIYDGHLITFNEKTIIKVIEHFASLSAWQENW